MSHVHYLQPAVLVIDRNPARDSRVRVEPLADLLLSVPGVAGAVVDRQLTSASEHLVQHGHLRRLVAPGAGEDDPGARRPDDLLQQATAAVPEDVLAVQRVEYAIDVEEDHSALRALGRARQPCLPQRCSQLPQKPRLHGPGVQRRAHLALPGGVAAEAVAEERGRLRPQRGGAEVPLPRAPGLRQGGGERLPRGARGGVLAEEALERHRLVGGGEAPRRDPPQVLGPQGFHLARLAAGGQEHDCVAPSARVPALDHRGRPVQQPAGLAREPEDLAELRLHEPGGTQGAERAELAEPILAEADLGVLAAKLGGFLEVPGAVHAVLRVGRAQECGEPRLEAARRRGGLAQTGQLGLEVDCSLQKVQLQALEPLGIPEMPETIGSQARSAWRREEVNLEALLDLVAARDGAPPAVQLRPALRRQAERNLAQII